MDNSTPATAPAYTVNQILDKFLTDYVPHELAESTTREYRRHVTVLRQWYGERIASELKPKDFAEFLHANGRQRGKFQRGKQLSVLSVAFSEAVSTWFWLEHNVLREIKKPRGKPRDRLVSDEEFRTFRARVPYRVQLAMDLALLTGQRQGDILGLRWAQVSDAIYIEQRKTGKRLAIEITPDLEAVLDRCWMLPNGGHEGGEYVLTRRCGGRYTCEGFRALFQRCMRRWVRDGNVRFCFHDLRAKAATMCPTVQDAQRLLGHSTPAMTLRVYRRGIERAKPVQLGASI